MMKYALIMTDFWSEMNSAAAADDDEDDDDDGGDDDDDGENNHQNTIGVFFWVLRATRIQRYPSYSILRLGESRSRIFLWFAFMCLGCTTCGG